MYESWIVSLQHLGDLIWGWPLLGFIIGTGIILTVALDFVQFRYFFASWRAVFAPEQSDGAAITPFQAFLNSLSASVGNGALTGMATAIYSGGPGAAFWVFLLGFFTMSIRFAEVYAGTSRARKGTGGEWYGGPMAYIQDVPGGSVLVMIYVFFCLMLTFFSGNAMQCQAITKGMTATFSLPDYGVAAILVLFLWYVMAGGAQRVLQASDVIVPLKVALFFIATFGALVYHYDALWGAVVLMVRAAFTPSAIAGGVIGYTVQDALRFGMARSLNATEAGLGTAGILYGGTGSKNPVHSGIMAMATSFMSNHLVCFAIMLLIVASGAWQVDSIGTGMTIAAYQSVYGSWGGIIVTTLSVLFGLGVLVTYAYIGRECWRFLTGNRGLFLYMVLYIAMALLGALADVALVWHSIDIAVAGLVIINLYALLCALPTMRQAVYAYKKS